MCTVLTTVKPCVVARLRRANLKRCKGARDYAGRGVGLAAGLRVIGADGEKRDRVGAGRCAGDTGEAGLNGRDWAASADGQHLWHCVQVE